MVAGSEYFRMPSSGAYSEMVIKDIAKWRRLTPFTVFAIMSDKIDGIWCIADSPDDSLRTF